jgi:hypothetical protein
LLGRWARTWVTSPVVVRGIVLTKTPSQKLCSMLGSTWTVTCLRRSGDRPSRPGESPRWRMAYTQHPYAYAGDRPVEVLDTISNGEAVSCRFEIEV